MCTKFFKHVHVYVSQKKINERERERVTSSKKFHFGWYDTFLGKYTTVLIDSGQIL